MKTQTVIKECPDNSVVGQDEVELTVSSHWNYTDRVVLKINDKEYTFIAAELRMAITNAMNHN